MLVAALLLFFGGAHPADAADAPLYRAIRRLHVDADGRHFGEALAARGGQLLVGAPNLDGHGTPGVPETAHGYVFDPATGTLVHDLQVEVDDDRYWQFSVGTVGDDWLVGIAPGTAADGLGGSVTVFGGDTGGTRQTLCCTGAIAIGVGDDVAIGAPGGAGLYDPTTGNLVRTFTIPDPNRQGVQSMALVGKNTLLIAAAQPVGVFMFDVATARQVGFVGTRHGDARHFGSAMAVNGATLAVTEIPQVNLFDLGFGLVLGTIDPPPGLGGASFGTALAYVGGLLAVGAPSGGGVGAVHLYDGNGNLVASLPAGDAGSTFGRSVVGLGRSVAVGAPTDDGGEVVVFSPCGDGTVDAPVEQCDDGNAVDDDACDNDCRIVPTGDGATCGDADASGAITVTDGVQVLRAAAGLDSSCTLARCDVDGSGAIGVTDGVQVLRAAAGLPFVGHCESRTASE